MSNKVASLSIVLYNTHSKIASKHECAVPDALSQDFIHAIQEVLSGLSKVVVKSTEVRIALFNAVLLLLRLNCETALMIF